MSVNTTLTSIDVYSKEKQAKHTETLKQDILNALQLVGLLYFVICLPGWYKKWSLWSDKVKNVENLPISNTSHLMHPFSDPVMTISSSSWYKKASNVLVGACSMIWKPIDINNNSKIHQPSIKHQRSLERDQ